MNVLKKNRNKQLIKDVIFIYLLLFLSIIFRYFLPTYIGSAFFLILLLISFFSDKDYFWIPFYLLLISMPGYLFFNEGEYALPALNIPNLGREIYYNEIVCLLYILKAFIRKSKIIPIFYKKSLFLIFGYSIILFILGFVLGVSLLKVLRTLRFILPLVLLFVIPKLVFTHEEKVISFINILFALVFFCVLAQLIDIIFGIPLATFFGETMIIFAGHELETTSKIVFDVNEEAVRTIYGVFILFVSFITGLFYIVSENVIWKKLYLYLIVSLCFLSVFLSATRGWIIAFSTILVLFFLIFPKNLRISFSGIIIVILLMMSSSKIEKQITGSLDRIESINYLLKGDITAGGTLQRISERSPRVMTKFKESPIYGFGFSDEYYKFADGHVGNQTLLLNGGIIGYLIYSIFWLVFIWTLFKGRLYSKSLYVFIFAFFGLFIIHSSSRIIFSYALDVEDAFGLGIFFAFSNFYLQKYRAMTYKQTLSSSHI